MAGTRDVRIRANFFFFFLFFLAGICVQQNGEIESRNKTRMKQEWVGGM